MSRFSELKWNVKKYNNFLNVRMCSMKSEKEFYTNCKSKSDIVDKFLKLAGKIQNIQSKLQKIIFELMIYFILTRAPLIGHIF